MAKGVLESERARFVGRATDLDVTGTAIKPEPNGSTCG